jgi:hypothetical protein
LLVASRVRQDQHCATREHRVRDRIGPRDTSGRVAAPDDLDLCSPCSYCGACCTGTYFLWFAAGERRRTAEIDQPTLDAVFERSFGAGAPAIVQAWNVDGGLSEAADGGPTDAAELAALLERYAPELDDDGRLAGLAAFARAAERAGAILHIRDD